MEKLTKFYNLDKYGGEYACNYCLNELEEPRFEQYMHRFKWEDIKIMPVGYKGNYKLYLKCPRCDNIISIPENIVPKTKLFKIKLKKIL